MYHPRQHPGNFEAHPNPDKIYSSFQSGNIHLRLPVRHFDKGHLTRRRPCQITGPPGQMKPQLKGETPTQGGGRGISHSKTLKSPLKSHKNAKTQDLGLRVWGFGLEGAYSNLSTHSQRVICPPIARGTQRSGLSCCP